MRQNVFLRYKDNDVMTISKNIKFDKQIYKNFYLPTFYTEIEIILPIYKYITKNIEKEEMHFAIDLTFDFLNHLITSIKVRFHSPGVRRLLRQDLQQLIPVKIIRSSSFKVEMIAEYGIENLHFSNLPEEPRILTFQEV